MPNFGFPAYIKDVFLGDHPAAVLEFHQQQYESPFSGT